MFRRISSRGQRFENSREKTLRSISGFMGLYFMDGANVGYFDNHDNDSSEYAVVKCVADKTKGTFSVQYITADSQEIARKFLSLTIQEKEELMDFFYARDEEELAYSFVERCLTEEGFYHIRHKIDHVDILWKTGDTPLKEEDLIRALEDCAFEQRDILQSVEYEAVEAIEEKTSNEARRIRKVRESKVNKPFRRNKKTAL